MKKFQVFIIASLLLFSGCGRKPVQQNKIPAKPPGRIVSLVPSITEALFALGAGDKVVGVTISCQRPEEAKQKEKVGTMLEPDIQKIVRLMPDLVLVTQEGNRKEKIEEMRSAGLSVFTFGRNETLRDVCGNFRRLGRIVGKQGTAEEILTLLDIKIAKVKGRVSGRPRVGVFCEFGIEPLITVAKGTLIDELIWLAGGVNIAHEEEVRYPKYGIEEVAERNPDVIIVVGMDREMGGDINMVLNQWSMFREVRAVARSRIYLIDPYFVCSPNPIALTEGLEQIARLIHPRAYKEKIR